MKYSRACLAIAFLVGTGTSCADVLVVPKQETSGEERRLVNLELPGRGISMARVEETYGTPLRKIPGVGEPAITRWIYDDYTVYFEGKYVIHAVLTRK